MDQIDEQKLRSANDLLAHRDFAQSERLFGELLAAGSYLPESLYGIGLIRFHSNQPDLAVKQFLNCVSIQPSNANAHFYLGLLAEGRKDAVEASRFFRRTLELNPQHAGALKKINLTTTPPAGVQYAGSPGGGYVERQSPSPQPDFSRQNPGSPYSSSDPRIELGPPNTLSPVPNRGATTITRNDLYAMLRTSEEPVEKEISYHLDGIAAIIGSRHPRARGYFGFPTVFFLIFIFILFLLAAAGAGGRNAALPMLGLTAIISLLWIMNLVFAIITARSKHITCERDWLVSTKGVFSKAKDYIHLIVLSRNPVRTERNLLNRMLNEGSLVFPSMTFQGYFRKNELDALSRHFTQLSMLNPTSRQILSAIGELKNIRSGEK